MQTLKQLKTHNSNLQVPQACQVSEVGEDTQATQFAMVFNAPFHSSMAAGLALSVEPLTAEQEVMWFNPKGCINRHTS